MLHKTQQKMRYTTFNITQKKRTLSGSIVKALMCFIICIYANYGFSQTLDLTACAVNIMDGAQIETQQLQAYNNLILLQSGTMLTIDYFEGETTFVHGLKALEEKPNFTKPILRINRCHVKSRLNIDLENIIIKLDKSCGIKRTNQSIISILN